jgi:hypothetical protein
MDRHSTHQAATYVAPTITHHGHVVAQTRGTCTCTTEQAGFKPGAPPEWWQY